MRMHPRPLASPVRYANRRRPEVELLIAPGADVLGHADWLRHRGLAHTPAASPMSPGWTGEAPARFRTKPAVDMAGCGCIPATLPPDDGSMFFAGKRPLTGARNYAPEAPRAVRGGRARQIPHSQFAPDTDSLIAIDSKEFGALSMFLDLGFQGIGEILVHGHHSHCFDNSDLLTICKFGAKYKVPVMFHWDCGTIDTDESVTTTTENMRQFLWLLNFIIMAGIDCDVVLAHRAAGPTAGACPKSYGDSIALYRYFLSGLDPAVQAAVLNGNAAVLYP